MAYDLVLYYYEECPYCQKVLRFLKDSQISVTLKNTRTDSKAREELMKIGGKSQVPCLVINGKPLYESVDIIAWLKENIVYVG